MCKLYYKKLAGKKNGFTLIELMIVIAIIAILAVVLIPQALKMKDSAKLSGVDANIRSVQATVESIIDGYSTKASLSTALRNRLNNTIKNPFKTDVLAVQQTNTEPGAEALVDPTASVMILAINTGTDTETTYEEKYSSASSVVYGRMKGTVLVVCYGAEASLSGVVLYGFDENGRPITSADKAAYYTIKK